MKKIAFLCLIGLVGIQFSPTKRNQNKTISDADFAKTFEVPKNVLTILKTSCYDCHSNYTEYPWYNKIQPISWLLENHIKKGKSELNLSEFGAYSKRKRRSKLRAIINQIKDDEMPLTSYTLIHPNAKLSDKDKSTIINWIETNIN